MRLDDYIDGDVAYLIGLLIARGTITESGGLRQLTIEFPYSSLKAQGIATSFDQETSITETHLRRIEPGFSHPAFSGSERGA